MGRGLVPNAKSVGTEVLGYRIDFGPRYRICFGQDGESLIVLVEGGINRRQLGDIEQVKRHGREY